MNIEQLPLNLSSSELNINLKLYKIVKEIIQIGINDTQNSNLVVEVTAIIDLENSLEIKINTLNSSINNIRINSNNKKDKLKQLISTFTEENDFKLLRIALIIIKFKDSIRLKAQDIANDIQIEYTDELLNSEYDSIMKDIPYTMRVSGSLLSDKIFDEIQNMESYRILKDDIDSINDINPKLILQIQLSESINQAIKSNAGKAYELRFKTHLEGQSINFTCQSFDNNKSAVEYDFILQNGNNKKIGVSVKRTLRERYKQNHEEIDTLEVDGMFVVTLGTDLNEPKVDYILEKEKYFIIVASDVYDKHEYMRNNDRVFPSSELTLDFVNNLDI